MGQPGQSSSGSTGSSTDYVPKRAGTTWIIAVLLLIVGLVIGGAVGYLVAPGPTPTLTVSGKVWGGAYTGKVKPGFWYNADFFSNNSLSVPTTWPQFTALLWQIKNISYVKAPILSGDSVGWPLSDATEAFICQRRAVN